MASPADYCGEAAVSWLLLTVGILLHIFSTKSLVSPVKYFIRRPQRGDVAYAMLLCCKARQGTIHRQEVTETTSPFPESLRCIVCTCNH